MMSGFTNLTTNFPTRLESCPILKITVPKGAYSDKEIKKLYDNIKDQVGNRYLPVIVPEDVSLEVIDF